jgi:hypothetical protein
MNKKHQIPRPAHPHTRREALPWQQPKATQDPEAFRRVQAILNSPSYRRADTDIAFLADMESKRTARDAVPAWGEFLSLTEGMVLTQDDKVMRPTPFSPTR